MKTDGIHKKKDAGPFLGRTVAVVNDLSPDEQVYLYENTRQLKASLASGGNLSPYRINDPSTSIYVLFLEDSTRTRESFINAAKFHTTKLNVFDADQSSFSKNESYHDTFSMLCGYSNYSIFITRTKLEGVCRWLEASVGAFARRNGILQPAFINGGDGKHEHPTQEFLDEFTFLEQKRWNRKEIHIALIGDLFHGRTVHSKVDGLRIFENVQVDLIAPDELAMPRHYVKKMEDNGFKVREFPAIDLYLRSKSCADIWYFTRPQLERMGDKILQKAQELRAAITFEKRFIENSSISKNTRFYHPLPRHREHPTIPTFLDDSSLNGWEAQSINGYYTRIILLSLLGGKAGSDFGGEHRSDPEYDDDFVEEISPSHREKPEYKVGIKRIERGVVIDHIEKSEEPETIWNHIDKIRRIMKLNRISSHGVYRSEKDGKYKGIISIPDLLGFGNRERKKLAAISPDCTLNVIEDRKVIQKFKLHMPPRIYDFKKMSCKNEDCISFPSHHENVMQDFHRMTGHIFKCAYCEKPHHFKEIWDI